MKITPKMMQDGLSNVDIAFSNFYLTISDSLKSWDYFVNWDKVFENVRQIEVDLNIWNFLLGKQDFDSEFRLLLEEHPHIVRAIPILIVRDGANSEKFNISDGQIAASGDDLFFDFSIPANNSEQISLALKFVKESGLYKVFSDQGVKNLVDYVIGVEAGLDSNGRKNRSGKSMEKVVGTYLREYALKNSLILIPQASQNEIFEKFEIFVPTDKATRRFDFVLGNKEKIVIFEVNFYSGGGSKLSAISESYKELHNLLSVPKVDFVWITDGKGWETARLPLRSAFEKLHYVWNLSWLNKGYLDDIFDVANDGDVV